MPRLNLVNLPDCISSIVLQGFLSPDDYAQLLNTSKKYFSEIKKSNIIYSLTEEDSLKYCTDEIFRQRLLGSVINPSRQIKLRLGHDDCVRHKAILEKDLIHLFMTNITVIKNSSVSFPGCKRAYVKCTDKLVDLSSFIGVETLHIDMEDLSQAQSTVALASKNCNNGLYDLKSLTLSHCKSVMVLSGFNQLLYLQLFGCPNIVDFIPLKGIRTLKFSMCTSLTELSVLGDHHELSINYCSYNLKGYEILKTVKNISLNSCDIIDLSVLSHAQSVNLSACHEVRDVSPLVRVKSVSLAFCDGITDISSLANVPSLSLGGLRSLTTYDGIDRVKRLTAHYTDNIQTTVFPTALYLELCQYDFDNNFLKRFTNLRKLTIFFLKSELNIVGCEDIHEVVIYYCDNLRSITGLGRNRVVRIEGCKSESLDVSSLSNVPIVTIIHCKKINDLSCLRNVPRLKLHRV